MGQVCQIERCYGMFSYINHQSGYKIDICSTLILLTPTGSMACLTLFTTITLLFSVLAFPKFPANTATLRKHFTQSTSIKTTSKSNEETAVETTNTKSQTTHPSTSVPRISLSSTEDSTDHYLVQTILSTSVSPCRFFV